MIRNLRAATCSKSRLPLFAILVAIWAANGSPGISAEAVRPVAAQTATAPLIQMEHISVQVIGKGSPLILIPGLSSPRAVWDGVAPELARNHMVYLVQVNGFGGEDPRANLAPGVIDGVVADLHKLIGERKLAKPAVIGHSMGGLATLMLARTHPGDVGKAMIVDALPFVGTAFFPGATVESVKPQAEAMRAQMAGLYGQTVPEGMLAAIAAQNAAKPDSRAKIAEWMAKTDMRVSAQALYEDLQIDLRGKLGAISAPVTVLVPAMGAEAEAKLGLYRGEYAGAAKLTMIPVNDSGHFVMLDQPEAFRAALTAFLAR